MHRNTTCSQTFSFLIFCFLFLILASSCSIEKQISRSAQQVITDPSLKTAHVGISIYEPETGKRWYDHNGDKYFVPASNTKIPTCYAGMKYLDDSLVGLRYGYADDDTAKKLIVFQPTGDPTFLHTDYKSQPAFDFLKKRIGTERFRVAYMDTMWQDQQWGSGWSWNDYAEYYMAERSPFPVFGNVIDIALESIEKRIRPVDAYGVKSLHLFKTGDSYFDSLINSQRVQGLSTHTIKDTIQYVSIQREIGSNSFMIEKSGTPFTRTTIPFATMQSFTAMDYLSKTLNREIGIVLPAGKNRYYFNWNLSDAGPLTINTWHLVKSQPTDSMLRPMMHRSDNFFAEQTLLMVSNEKLGIMSDSKIIDTLLKTDLKDLPQKPRWADGSGLSRYNLFTPQDFVFILNKIKTEFGMDRVKDIFPTGGEGTLRNYYKADSTYIYAKTGSLSGVLALSGYLYTKKGKLLIFSTLVNNHQASPTDIRRAIERFLQGIRNKY
jgi:serine-type D-Ala-D-Ala carboxypeptidase/endopeptidase (penicillin-binding protein 4)